MGRGGGSLVSGLACYPTIRVRIPLKPTVLAVKFVLQTNGNKLKRGRGWPIQKRIILS